MILPLLVAAAATPQPGALRTFGDWIVGCDNGRACQANALVPEGEERDRYLLVVITRDPAGAALPQLRFVRAGAPGPTALRVDGKLVGRLTPDRRGAASIPFNRALASALANGARVAAAGGSASLKGLAAAFLYMDEQQGRLGTQGALRRLGPKPDAAVPPPPALPRIVQPATAATAPRTILAAEAARLIGRDNAVCDDATAAVKPRAVRLDAGHSLVLVDHPCGNGAYNLFTSAFVVDAAGRAARARFDAPHGMGPDVDPAALVNAAWDASARRLTSYAKGRGLGDCGSRQAFAWDGAGFRLAWQADMGECRGSADYITTWRAQVVAR
jgi:hypothetical protein